MLEADISTLHIYQGVDLFHQNDFASALVEFDQALALGENAYARWDRALTLLAMGRYGEGFADYGVCRQIFWNELTPRGNRLMKTLRPWRGERVPVIVLHEAGYGDSIQLMRCVELVKQMAGLVALEMPPPLARLAAQLAPIIADDDEPCFEYAIPTFDLMSVLGLTPQTVPPPPYLNVPLALRAEWARKIGERRRRRIGIAWSTKLGSANEHPNARRDIELDLFVTTLRKYGELYSLQTQRGDEARARGVKVFELEDFADVAALASLMDSIVSIDTAALHIAGAIGHHDVCALLPYAATWRWLNGSPWYPRIKQCRQKSPGDWASAFDSIAQR